MFKNLFLSFHLMCNMSSSENWLPSERSQGESDKIEEAANMQSERCNCYFLLILIIQYFLLILIIKYFFTDLEKAIACSKNK